MKNSHLQQKQLPIGYYLKLVDSCLTKGIDQIHAKYGLNRIEWQVLNSINEKSEISKSDLFELMKPVTNSQSLEDILIKHRDKNNIMIKGDLISLTNEGRLLYRSCFNIQQEFRKKALNGISDDDYETTISTLQKIIANIS